MKANKKLKGEQPPVLGEDEKLGCSLISQYPYRQVKDVITEACLHQLDVDVAYYEPTIQELREQAERLVDKYREWISPDEHKKAIQQARAEGIRKVVEFLHRQGAVWVDKNYAIIKAIENGEAFKKKALEGK